MQGINNHVHSTYSFSSYASAEIPAKAQAAGLGTVGIMNHDSVSGCAEFLDAAKKIGIPRSQFGAVVDFLKPIHDARIMHDRKEVDLLNVRLVQLGAPQFDCDKDVVAISEATRGCFGDDVTKAILYSVEQKYETRQAIPVTGGQVMLI